MPVRRIARLRLVGAVRDRQARCPCRWTPTSRARASRRRTTARPRPRRPAARPASVIASSRRPRRAVEHDRLQASTSAAGAARSAAGRDRRGVGAPPVAAAPPLVCSSSSTISSYVGLFMKFVHRDVDRRRCLLARTVGQILVGDHQIVGVGQVGDRLVDHRDVAEARRLDLLAEHRGAHRRGPHAGVAGEHDRRGSGRRARPCRHRRGRPRPTTSCPSWPPCRRSRRPGPPSSTPVSILQQERRRP